MIVGLLGGRAAEEIVFHSITTGASNDIERATKLARAMITRYGMSERFGLMALEEVESQYLGGQPMLICGDATAAQIDEEVMAMLKDAYAEAKRLLLSERRALDEIAGYLIEKETITGKEFMQILKRVQAEEKGETAVEGDPSAAPQDDTQAVPASAEDDMQGEGDPSTPAVPASAQDDTADMGETHAGE